MADYYSILGLTKNATDIEIKSAFRKLAKTYHPDKNHDPNARILFERILKAYDTLINPHTRRRYDNNISFSSSIPPNLIALRNLLNEEIEVRKNGIRMKKI